MPPTSSSAPQALVLWADESSPNLGVATLARGSRDLLKRVNPEFEISFANYGAARPSAVPWGRPRSLIRERVQGRFGMQDYFSQFDLVWDTRSGDSFADIYGIDRHLTMGLVHEFARQAGPTVAMAPQTIGPFGSKRAQAVARRNLKRSHFVFSRDPESTRVASELGRPADLTTADLVFAIDPPTAEKSRDVLLNVSGLLWRENPHVSAEKYQQTIRALVPRLRAEGREVALFAHVLDSPDSDNDVPAVRAVARELGEDLEIVVPTSLDSAREIIAGAELVVGSRMHACLNSLSVGVPAIPLAYSRKFAPLLNSVGWEPILDLRGDETAVQLATAVVNASAKVTAAGARDAACAGRASLDAIVDLLAPQEREHDAS